MGCESSQSVNEPISKYQDKLTTAKYLETNELISFIISNPKLFGLLHQDIFHSISTSLLQTWYSPSQKEELTSQILIYLRECINRSLSSKAVDPLFFEKLGEKILRIQNEAFFFNKNFLNILSYIGKTSQKFGCFLDLNFDMSPEQSLSVARRVRELFKYDSRAFLFLAQYLLTSCYKLEESGRSLLKIEQTLDNTLGMIQSMFPPAPFLPNTEEAKYHKSFQIEETQMKPIVLDLRNVPSMQRKETVVSFIMERAEEARKNKQRFINLIEEICREKGSHLKIGVKVKDKDHHRAIDRVIQKIIKKGFSKFTATNYEKNINEGKAPTLDDYLQEEELNYRSQMKNIYDQIKEPIPFKVSDMLRGKCLFQTVSEINECASKLKAAISQQKFTLMEINNRLTDKTSDLVFKILIGNTITQLQLPIDFNIANNEFDHKVYEVKRSAFHSQIMMLKIMVEEGGQFLAQAYQCMRQVNRGQTHQEQIKFYDSLESFKSLEEPLIRLLQIMKYQKAKQEKQQCNKSHLKEFEEIQQISLKKNVELPKSQLLRFHKNNSDYYRSCHSYEKEMEENRKYIKQLQATKSETQDIRKQIIVANVKMGDALKGKGILTKALQSYEASLKMVPKLKGPESQKLTATIYNQIGLVYNDLGKYKEAADHYTKSLEKQNKLNIQNQINSNSIVKTLANLGVVYFAQGLYKQALENYKKSLEISEKMNGKGSYETGTTLKNIGAVYFKEGRFSEALEFYTRSLQVQQKFKGKGAIETASTLKNIGLVYLGSQRYKEALEYSNQSLMIEEKIKGKQSIQAAGTLCNIGSIYSAQKMFKQALEYFNKCLSIQEKIKGKGAIDTATTLNNIGLVHDYQGKRDEALQFYKNSLQIIQSAKGKDSIDSTVALNNSGQVYRKKGDFNKALIFYTKCLEIQQRVLGKQSIDSAATFNNIGVLYRQKKDYSKALEYFTKCMKIQQKIKGNDAIDTAVTLNNIGQVYSAQGKYNEALGCYNKCLEIQEWTKGKETNDLTITLNNLGRIYKQKKDYKQALKYYSSSLGIIEKIKGKQAAQITNILSEIGSIHSDSKQYAEAMKYYSRCLQIQEAGVDCNQLDISNTVKQIGLIHYGQKQHKEALDCFIRCLSIQQREKGNNSPSTLYYLKLIASNYKYLKQYQKAIDYYHQYLEVQEKGGKVDEDTASALNEIASIYSDMGEQNEALKYYCRCLEVEEKVEGKQSIATATTFGSIGLTLLYLSKKQQAIEKMKQSMRIFAVILGQNSPQVKQVQSLIQQQTKSK